jgi:hypothetical protein
MALGGGQTGRSSTTGEAPWRFSVAVPILRRQSGANLAGGCLGRPVHGEVAGAHGGGITGEVAGRNR